MSTQKNQLYIGDLPVTVNEEFIKSTLFGEYPAITEVIIKKKEGIDKCFAFVRFDTTETASRVLQEMNYTKLDGVPIRMSWSDPETRKIRVAGRGNLYIKGLDENIEVSQLHEAFSNFGEIISCKIPMSNKNGLMRSNGYGYIQFRNPEDADKARRDLKDASINDKKIQIEEYKKQTKKSTEETYTNIYAKGFDPAKYADEEAIRPVFEQFGVITSIKMMQSRPNMPSFSQPLPFVFCNFENHESAKNAVERLDLMQEGPFIWSCGRMMSKTERQQHLQKEAARVSNEMYERTKGRNLYVRNFDENVDDEQLKEFFSQFGEVESSIIMRDRETRVSKKFGFVCFTTKESAERAITETLDKEFQDKLLYVALIQRKSDRIAMNSKYHQQRSNPQAVNAFDNLPKRQPADQPVNELRNPDADFLLKEYIDRGFDEKAAKLLLKEKSAEQIKKLVNDHQALVKHLDAIANKKP